MVHKGTSPVSFQSLRDATGSLSEPLPCFSQGLEPRAQCLIDTFPQRSGGKVRERLPGDVGRAGALWCSRPHLSSRRHRSGVDAAPLGVGKPQARGTGGSGLGSDARFPGLSGVRVPAPEVGRWRPSCRMAGGDGGHPRGPGSSAPRPFPLPLPWKAGAPAASLVCCCVFAG